MPPLKWATNPIEPIGSFETRHRNPTSGALFFWAASTVESLHYLHDIDQTYETSGKVAGDHSPDVVDVAHARWATATCITALDLCAAGLGRAFCKPEGKYEFSLVAFDHTAQRSAKFKKCLAQLPPLAQEWIKAVCDDPVYKRVKNARDWLTHSRVPRHITLGAPRLELEFGQMKVNVAQVVSESRDCATEHVAAFLKRLPRI